MDTGFHRTEYFGYVYAAYLLKSGIILSYKEFYLYQMSNN